MAPAVRLALVPLMAVLAIPTAWGDEGRHAPGELSAQGCRLLAAVIEELPSRACLVCHDGSGERPFCPGHQVGTPYPEDGDERYTLRTRAEFLRRGINLPEGKLECVTCHDRRSPWERHLSLPPGTTPLPRVDPHDRSTYENRPNWRVTLHGGPPPAPGAPVCPAMLCVSCHAFADPQ